MRRIIAIALLALTTLAACANDDTNDGAGTPTPTGTGTAAPTATATGTAKGTSTGTVKPKPAPKPTTIAEKEWRITVPNDWKREDWTKNADASKAIRYSAANGSYFIVALDPKGSGYEGDEVWRYEPDDGKFRVVSKESCQSGKPGCPKGDKRFDVYVFARQTGASPPKVAGHVWYFIFGDTNNPTADTVEFERILKSVEVRD